MNESMRKVRQIAMGLLQFRKGYLEFGLVWVRDQVVRLRECVQYRLTKSGDRLGTKDVIKGFGLS